MSWARAIATKARWRWPPESSSRKRSRTAERSSAAIAAQDPESLPMPRARGRALVGMCAALAAGDIVLDRGADRDDVRHALLALPGSDANRIFGSPDDLKLRSSMTLFGAVPGADTVFQAVLDKFFGGAKDAKTVQLLG